MNRICVAMIALSLTLATGCGGTSDDTNPTDPSESSTCSGTVSGSVSAKITGCHFTWMNNSAQALVGNYDHIDSTADDDHQFGTIGFHFVLPSGPAMLGTFDGTNVKSMGGGLDLPSGGSYVVSKPELASQGPTVGTMSIHITSVTPGDLPDWWNLHGTLSAQLDTPPGITTYSGSATVAITF